MTFKLKKDQQYMFVTDLDGTFLSGFIHSLHIDSYEAVRKALDNGHRFVIATGRSWWWTKTLYEQLGLQDASIHFHGAIVHHPGDRNFEEYRSSMSSIDMKNMAKELDIWSFASEVQAVGRKYHAAFTKGDDINKLFFNCYEFIIRWDESKMSKSDFIDKAEKALGDGFIIRVWRLFGEEGSYSAIISPQKTNKAIALEKVSKYYGIPRENIIYFGDNINDIEALEWAGQSYAVSNARQEAKDVANDVLDGSCNDGAVPKKIIELIDESNDERN